jgi:hypothetical protein
MKNLGKKFTGFVNGALRLSYLLAIFSSLSLLGGCAILDAKKLSQLPDAIEIAAENTKGNDFPKLVDIPPAPTNLRTDSQWIAHDKQLVDNSALLFQNKNSQQPSAIEADVIWANNLRNNLNNNAKAIPVTQTEAPAAWAARVRALLDIKSTQKPQ